jgi:intracellular septation protein
MQLLIEFLPIVAFFIAYKLSGMYVATGVLIAAVIVQSAVEWIRRRKVNPMMLASARLVLVFGGLTLALQDPTFVKWKPTILYALFAVVFVGSRFVSEKPIVERILGENIQLQRAHWNALNTVWAIFFLAMGAANLYVAYTFDENTWVNFKLFGLLGLMLVFTLAQGIWIAAKMPPEDELKEDELKADRK